MKKIHEALQDGGYVEIQEPSALDMSPDSYAELTICSAGGGVHTFMIHTEADLRKLHGIIEQFLMDTPF
jgi:hypothetical protein